ncbi:MAG TPA: c-type cytochrome [Polyangiales bacterium]|nr:c-type cytochrome [Polyangiales bacterium]
MSSIRDAHDLAKTLLSLSLLLAACGSESASTEVAQSVAPPSSALAAVPTTGVQSVTATAPAASQPAAPMTSPATTATSTSPSVAAAAGAGAPPTAASTTAVMPAAGDSGWCGVKQTIDTRCTVCHNEQKTAGAPMSLETYADLKAPAVSDPKRKVFELVKERVHDKVRPMPPQGALTDAQLAAIDAWVASGAAAGADATCSGNMLPTEAKVEWPPKNCDQMYTIRAAPENAPNKVGAGEEVHPQTMIQSPWGSEEVQAIAWKSLNDNMKVLHHWILYGPQGEFLFGWAPGKDYNQPLPADVGVYLPTGMLQLDMHYNNITGTQEEKDASGVEICALKKANFRPKTATITMMFASTQINIPAHATNQDVTGTCTHMGQPVRLLSASPHAHKNAHHMKFTLEKANGQKVVMHDALFDFNEQTTYPLDPPLVVEQGDRIVTTCTFSNDTDQAITFGENTGNEMCFNFAMYEPKDGLSCANNNGGGMFPRF